MAEHTENFRKKAIELEQVSFHYEGDERYILKNADFDVAYGEIALLSGFSGEGKSTVLSLLCGIIPNVTPGEISGEIKIDGMSILGRGMNEICRKIGVVLQNAQAQIIQQLVEDEIAFGCENFDLPKEEIAQRIGQSCDMMQLEPQWKTRTLSGGQKQRLMTAATFATGQKILVLDEPLANLDKAGTKLLMQALRRLAQEEYAILLIEHRLDMVISYVDTVWRINSGCIEKVVDKKAYLKAQAGIIQDTCTTADGQRLNGKGFELDHVQFSVRGRRILEDISLEVYQGERLLLLGENGCGKTTQIRTIARLQKATGGKIVQHIDERISQKPKGTKEWFKQVGVVYQDPNYQLFMPSVREEVAYGAESLVFAEKIMDMFGIRHLENRHPHSLSEGQKRRVSIAAVVATKPKVLLLDEPTVGQDYEGLKALVNVLNQIHEETGNTMITVTHDMRCAQALCDRAVLIQDGKIAAEGGKDFVMRYFTENDMF